MQRYNDTEQFPKDTRERNGPALPLSRLSFVCIAGQDVRTVACAGGIGLAHLLVIHHRVARPFLLSKNKIDFNKCSSPRWFRDLMLDNCRCRLRLCFTCQLRANRRRWAGIGHLEKRRATAGAHRPLENCVVHEFETTGLLNDGYVPPGYK